MILQEMRRLREVQNVPDEHCIYKVRLIDYSGEYIKIGYTRNLAKRKYEFEKLGFKVRVIQTLKGPEEQLKTYEAFIHARLIGQRKHHPEQFSGYSEMYQNKGIPGLKSLIKMLQS